MHELSVTCHKAGCRYNIKVDIIHNKLTVIVNCEKCIFYRVENMNMYIRKNTRTCMFIRKNTNMYFDHSFLCQN